MLYNLETYLVDDAVQSFAYYPHSSSLLQLPVVGARVEKKTTQTHFLQDLAVY